MKNSISLHPEHGLNPSVEQAVCPVCTKTFDTNSILLLGHNKGKEAPRHTITKWQLCPEDQKKRDDGYIALIACDPEKSTIKEGRASLEGVYRTGAIIHIKAEAFGNLIESPVPDNGIAFVHEDIVRGLIVLANQ